MLTLFLGVDRVANYADTQRADPARFADFFRRMLAEGIYLPPSQFETMFLSLAHSEADVERLGEAARRALAGA
jgi:glutamate-1-semialdehyde 2,1-aminomutase